MCHENANGNRCPKCKGVVPAAEWVSYRMHEDCWAGNRYLPKSEGRVVVTVGKAVRSDRRE